MVRFFLAAVSLYRLPPGSFNRYKAILNWGADIYVAKQKGKVKVCSGLLPSTWCPIPAACK